jgi:hypothetical protein
MNSKHAYISHEDKRLELRDKENGIFFDGTMRRVHNAAAAEEEEEGEMVTHVS